jgi:hypothetical protein
LRSHLAPTLLMLPISSSFSRLGPRDDRGHDFAPVGTTKEELLAGAVCRQWLLPPCASKCLLVLHLKHARAGFLNLG